MTASSSPVQTQIPCRNRDVDYVNVSGVFKSFDSRGADAPVKVLENICIAVERGEILTIFGPNGCGKTTLLNIISGVVQPDQGDILIGDKEPRQTAVGYVFQNYRESLFPWRSALDNICLALELRGCPRKERRLRARALLQDMGIELPLRAYPYQMSGGQQQLVAICGAVVGQPELLLMDEPFSALDYKTRLAMQDLLLHILTKTGITTIFVSHDLEEAVYLGDRLVLLSNKPTVVVENSLIPFPKPRDHSLLESEDFHRYRATILRKFRGVLEQ